MWGRDAARAPDYGRCRVGAEQTRRVRHEGGISGEDLPQRAERGVHKAAAVRALRVAECTRRVRAAHHTVRARAVCIRVTTRAPARAAPSHTQASTASRRADHATRPRRAPTRARGAERTDHDPHARWLAPPGPDRPMPRPGWRPRSVTGARRPPTRPPKNHLKLPIFFKPIPPTPTNTTPHPQKIITTPQNPKKIIQFFSTPPSRRSQWDLARSHWERECDFQSAPRKASGSTRGAAPSPHWDPRRWRGAIAGSHSPARGAPRVPPLGGRATTVRAPLPLGYLPIGVVVYCSTRSSTPYYSV